MTLQRCAMTLMAFLTTLSVASAGTLTFDFNNNTDFDGAGAGAVMTETNGLDTISITSVDILAPEFSSDAIPVLTGNTLSALAGDGVETNIGSPNALGVDNPSVSSSQLQAAGGPGNENRDFHSDEAWIIEFDEDVYVTEFNFSSLDSGSQFEVSVEGILAPFVFAAGVATGDDFSDPFAGLPITAGTNLTIKAVGPLATTSLRISEITITTVPEPTTLGLLAISLGASLVSFRRKIA